MLLIYKHPSELYATGITLHLKSEMCIRFHLHIIVRRKVSYKQQWKLLDTSSSLG